MSERGTRTNTCICARLRSLSRAPPIQYSCSGERMASDQDGSSPESKLGSAEPSEIEERKTSTEGKLEGVKSRGNKV